MFKFDLCIQKHANDVIFAFCFDALLLNAMIFKHFKCGLSIRMEKVFFCSVHFWFTEKRTCLLIFSCHITSADAAGHQLSQYNLVCRPQKKSCIEGYHFETLCGHEESERTAPASHSCYSNLFERLQIAPRPHHQ